jgi:S1-C subfamily serine protease
VNLKQILAALAFAVGLSTAANAQSRSDTRAIEQAVVKVFTVSRQPDVYRPWSRGAPQESTGSGVIIEGKRILTNAHVVNYASRVEVRAKEGGDKRVARVVAIARGIDLAVLELEDPSFFEGRTPPKRASVLPAIKDEVLAFGFPLGGDALSITKGIVSRIEFVAYNWPASGIRIQVDAAINPGNSGGPVFAGNQMLGLAFAAIGGAQNIGYIIPNEEIELFLTDIADGRYDGKPVLNDQMQTLENPALRSLLNIDRKAQGLVVQVPASTAADYPLKEWDLVTHIAGVPIDNQGMVALTPDLNIQAQYQVQKAARGGKLPLTVLRQGQKRDIEVPVSPGNPRVISGLQGSYPDYFVYGPIVFSRATWEFRSFMANNASQLNNAAFNAHALVTRLSDKPTPERQDLVVISSPFFPHPLVAGYDNRFGSVLKSVNDVPVRSLAHLVEMLRDMKSPLVTLKFDQTNAESIVVPHVEMVRASEAILADNGIRFQASPALLAIWNQR